MKQSSCMSNPQLKCYLYFSDCVGTHLYLSVKVRKIWQNWLVKRNSVFNFSCLQECPEEDFPTQSKEEKNVDCTRICVFPNSITVRIKPSHSIAFLVVIVKLKAAQGFVFVSILY